ncbi:MAG: class A beta-lactamase-related serine hydrolase [Cyclobacteriaceae bacterium]
MNYSLCFLFVSTLLGACTTQSAHPLQELESKITDRLSSVEGEFAVAFLDLDNNDTLLIQSAKVFHAASTMKTPVMIEVYKQASEGIFDLTDSIEINTNFKSIADGSKFELPASSDSEKTLYDHVGEKRTIAALTYDMIIRSSNLATNLIIELVGPDNVTQTMRELGARDLTVRRGVEDLLAYEQGIINTTTAYDLMLIYAALAKGEVVSESASTEMIDILMDQEFNHVIPAKLPAGVRVAHKTGSITSLQHDSGIVYLPNGKSYVLVLLSHKLGSREEAVEAMADVSKMIYDHKSGLND